MGGGSSMGEHPGLSEAEREVLKALWGHGPGTVRQLNGVLGSQGRRWAYTTVLTLLQRLQAKGYAASETAGVAHVFRATVSRDQLVERRLKDTADELCDGSAAAVAAGPGAGESVLARRARAVPPPARSGGRQAAAAAALMDGGLIDRHTSMGTGTARTGGETRRNQSRRSHRCIGGSWSQRSLRRCSPRSQPWCLGFGPWAPRRDTRSGSSSSSGS